MVEKNGLTKRETKEWEELKKQVHDVTMLFGGLLFLPVMFLVASGHGIRAGLLSGTTKLLEMMQDWGFGN